MNFRRHQRRDQHGRHRASVVALALFASVLAVAAGTAASPISPVHAAGLGAGGEYHPLSPTRIFDTRGAGINATPGAIATSSAGGLVDVQILGQGGVPAVAADVLAVAISITVTEPTQVGYLAAYPSGASAGISSVVNFAKGQNVPNLSVQTVGANGKLTIKVVTGVSGTAHVLIDVFGWFSTSNYTTNGARLIPVGPARIMDTREVSFNPDAQPLGSAGLLTLAIRGADSQQPNITDIVPNSPDIVGVVLNVTGINDRSASRSTYVSVLPETPVGDPTTSNLNLAAGQIKANLVIVPVGADGSVRFFNLTGATDIAVDVVGYMQANQSPTTRLGRVIPLTAPFRSLDTREPSFGNVALGPNQSEGWSFSQFVSSVLLDGQAVGNQIALLGNLTGTDLTRAYPSTPASTFFTVYPSDVDRPFASNINLTEGANVPNMAVVKLGADDQIKTYNQGGYLHYIFDVSAVVLED
ncbi:MAG: hypothetical protein ABIR32_10840 [Ilumatobacteraceae bacterium]